MKFKARSTEPIVKAMINGELWFSYVVYPQCWDYARFKRKTQQFVREMQRYDELSQAIKRIARL
jgi:hypothetical protein